MTRRLECIKHLFSITCSLVTFLPASCLRVVRRIKMLKVQAQIQAQCKNMAALTGVMLMAAAEALAQDNSSRPARRRIVVSIADRKLAVLEGDRTVRIFETAVGAPKSPSPTGVYQIVNRIADPTWYTKGKIVPPGKRNPLGTRWLGLSRKGYGIHGTNRPDSIGRNASHGCIRMRNREVEELFKMVTVGGHRRLPRRAGPGPDPPGPQRREEAALLPELAAAACRGDHLDAEEPARSRAPWRPGARRAAGPRGPAPARAQRRDLAQLADRRTGQAIPDRLRSLTCPYRSLTLPIFTGQRSSEAPPLTAELHGSLRDPVFGASSRRDLRS